MEAIKQSSGEPIEEGLGKPLVERWMDRGEARGIAVGERNLLRRQLTRRFGSLSDETNALLEAASTDDLERWAERLLDAPTLAEVFS